MIIVFGVLLVLMLVIKSQSFLLGGDYKKKHRINEKAKEVPVAVKEVDNNVQIVDVNKEYELVAAIMAAVSVSYW